MRSDAALLRVPPRSTGCEREGPHLVLGTVGYRVATHAGCTCNELRALTGRHLITRSQQLDVAYFKRQCFDVDVLVGNPLSKLQFIGHYSGGKKRMYNNAYHQLQQVVHVDAIARVKMFVKSEKLTMEKACSGAPRAIQYRTPEFNLLVGRWLKVYEESFYRDTLSAVGLPVIAKGMNNYARAANIRDASNMFQRPVYLLLDHAKFDSCVHEHLLKWTHRQYDRAFRNRYLRFLLSKTLNNRGRTANGIKYRVRATRMSGDYDTALGNCMVNYLLLRSWLQEIVHHILLDGDDSVVVVEYRDLERLLGRFNHFALMGFDTEIQIVHELREVEFCRARYLDIEPPRFARDPARTLSNWTVANSFVSPEYVRRYLAGVGLGELACNAGVPILGPCSRRLADLSDRPMLIDKYRYAYGIDLGPELVSDEARVAYAETFGVTVAEQLAIESEFSPHWERGSQCDFLKDIYESRSWRVEI